MTILELILKARREEFASYSYEDYEENGYYLNIEGVEIIPTFDEEVIFVFNNQVVARCNCDVLCDLLEGHVRTVITDNYMD